MKIAELFEARNPKWTYTFKEVKGRVEKVILELEAKDSELFTKSAKRFKEIDYALASLQEERDSMSAEIKDQVSEFFDAEDVLLTRVVETVSLTATLNKMSPPPTVIDQKAIISDLLKLMPELTEQIEELTRTHTTVGKQKTPGFSVKIPEGTVGDIFAKIKQKMAAVLSKIKTWATSYDKKLNAIKAKLEAAKV